MEIVIESLITGAKKARGLTVIIDVFRAFTTAAFVMNNGARKILPVETVDEAFELKKKNPDYILMGERKGIKVEGFDLGNSPFEIKDLDFTYKTVIMTTSAGTQGIVNAKNANEIIPGSFVYVNAIVKYIKNKNPSVVTIVAMGESGVEKSDEDELCAKYIKDLLEGGHPDFDEIKNYLRTYKSSLKFLDDSRAEFPKGDFDCAMAIDSFDFVLKVIRKPEGLMIIKSLEGEISAGF